MTPFHSAAVAAAYEAYPPALRDRLLTLRRWVFEEAAATVEVGDIEETLKWGQPSYVTARPRTGSTLRIASFDAHQVALFFHCQSSLVETFRCIFGDQLGYSGNRAVLFAHTDPLPETEARACIRSALTYHLDRRKARTRRPA